MSTTGNASSTHGGAHRLPPIATTTRLDNLVGANAASTRQPAAPTSLRQPPLNTSGPTSSHNSSSSGSFGAPIRRSERQPAAPHPPPTQTSEGQPKPKQSAKVNSSRRQNPLNAPTTYYYSLQYAIPKGQQQREQQRCTAKQPVQDSVLSLSSNGTSNHSSLLQPGARDSQADALVGAAAVPSPTNIEVHSGESDASVEEQRHAFLAERQGSTSNHVSPLTPASAVTANASTDPCTAQMAEEMHELLHLTRDMHSFFLSSQQQQQQQAAGMVNAPLRPAAPAVARHGEVKLRCGAARLNGAAPTAQKEGGESGSAKDATAVVPAERRKSHLHLEEEGAEKRDDNSSRKQSADSRYKEALRSADAAINDSHVALQRVEDYSASLYTLVETWMQLYENRFDKFARTVVQRMLDKNPSYRVLFFDMDVPAQSLVIMNMVGRAIISFARPMDLMEIMNEIGARHNLYGVHMSHFESMRDAFLEVYEEFVEPEVFSATIYVWRTFWDAMIRLAVSGSNSERGKIYTQRRNVVWAERLKKIFNRLVPLQCKGGFHQLMQAMYPKALARYPQAKNFVRMTEKRTAHRMMEVIIRIVKSIVENGVPDKIEYNEQLSVANLHTDTVHDYDERIIMKFEEPFLEACESFLAPVGAWNIQVRSILQELWSTYVTGYWLARPPEEKAKGKGATAPDGKDPFCLMFTDIEASTRLWAADAQSMGTAVTRHHKLIRGLIEDFEGYEVKTVGDSFLIATRTVTQALLIAFGIQLGLMMEASGPNFHMVENPQGTGDASCWRDDALRVRVGIHYCTDATAVYDSVHSRFDYYGPSVNCAARVEAAACGGQTLLSSDAYKRLQAEEAFSKLPVSSLLVEELGKLVQAQEARGIDAAEAAEVVAKLENEQHQKAEEASMHDTSPAAQVSGRHSSAGGVATTLMSLTAVKDEGLHTLKGIAAPVQLYSLLPPGLTGRAFANLRLYASSELTELGTMHSSNTSNGLSYFTA